MGEKKKYATVSVGAVTQPAKAPRIHTQCQCPANTFNVIQCTITTYRMVRHLLNNAAAPLQRLARTFVLSVSGRLSSWSSVTESTAICGLKRGHLQRRCAIVSLHPQKSQIGLLAIPIIKEYEFENAIQSHRRARRVRSRRGTSDEIRSCESGYRVERRALAQRRMNSFDRMLG